MSYYKCKGITLDRKNNKIWTIVASSNVYPITYGKYEYYENENIDFEEKLDRLILSIELGNIHIIDSMYKWTYALTRTREQFKDFWDNRNDNYTMYYTDKDKIPFSFREDRKKVLITEKDLESGKYIENYGYYYIQEEREEDYKRVKELEKAYCNTFRHYLEEEINGQYYLKSDKYGFIKNKGNKGSFYYDLSSPVLMDYKQAYCKLKQLGKQYQEDTKIIKLIEERTYIPTETQLKEKEERLKLLGIGDNTSDYKLIYDIINKFENEYKALVYYVDKGRYNFGKCYNLFYVSNYEEVYESDKDLLRNNETYAYVYNDTYNECSEIGLIGFEYDSYCYLEELSGKYKGTRLRRKY